MKVSVAFATYNRLEVLTEMLGALFAQDFPQNEYEILVTDDGSADGTREYLQSVAKRSPVDFKFHSQEQAGPAKARNWGIRQARGEIVAFTDDDCIPPHDWLSRIVDAFRRYPQVAGVSGMMEADEEILKRNIYARFEKLAPMGDYMKEPEKEYIGGKDFLGGATNNVAYKREVLLETGGFDETFPFAASEDADLKERIVSKGYLMLHLPLTVTHKHPYSFKRLMRQAYVRGVSSRHFNIKYGLPSTFWRFFLSSAKVAVRSLGLLCKRPFLVPLVFLYQWNFMKGVADYERVIR
ncbi:glycosyltransferase [Patescibacteria group bacterium]|nr:glycosyltransferase [Patescibacteria group bacterium]